MKLICPAPTIMLTGTALVSDQSCTGALKIIENSEDADFEHRLYELELWRLVTDLPKEKQGAVLFLSLNGKVRQACASLSKEE